MSQISTEEALELNKKLYYSQTIASVRMPSIEVFKDEHIKRYKENGYLIIDRLLSQVEIKDGLQEISDIIEKKIVGPKIQFVRPEKELKTAEERELATRKIYDYVEYAPALRHIAQHEGLLHIVEKFLGDKPVLVADQGLLKPPGGGTSGGEKPWHQDMAYGGLFYKKDIVTAWIALDDVGLDNGCMNIVPRSHLFGGAPHFKIRDWQICDTHVDVERSEAATMGAGAVLLFSGLLHHGTPANFSTRKRRAIQLRYAPASSELMSKEAFKMMFTSEITDAEC